MASNFNDKKWFFVTSEGDIGVRYSNEYSEVSEKVFDTMEDLKRFLSNQEIGERILKMCNKLIAVFDNFK